MVVSKQREVDLLDTVCQAVLCLLEVYFLTLRTPKKKKKNQLFFFCNYTCYIVGRCTLQHWCFLWSSVVFCCLLFSAAGNYHRPIRKSEISSLG